MDNRFSITPWPGAAVLGGGPGDAMAYSLGADPTQCPYRGDCRILGQVHWEPYFEYANIEPNPSIYGRRSGPSEDFAETFSLSVREPERLLQEAPQRAAWISNFAVTHLHFGLIPDYPPLPHYPLLPPTPMPTSSPVAPGPTGGTPIPPGVAPPSSSTPWPVGPQPAPTPVPIPAPRLLD